MSLAFTERSAIPVLIPKSIPKIVFITILPLLSKLNLIGKNPVEKIFIR